MNFPPPACPNAEKILAHAHYRGVADADLQYDGAFGWRLTSKSDPKEDGESLIVRVAEELGVHFSGTQITPEKCIEPWSERTQGPGRPLRGYIGCAASGERFNSHAHPGHGRATVDTLQFISDSPDDVITAVTHFKRLGYLCWIQGTVGKRFGAVMYLPKLGTGSHDRRTEDDEISEITESLNAAKQNDSGTFSRIARAVLGLGPEESTAFVTELLANARFKRAKRSSRTAARVGRQESTPKPYQFHCHYCDTKFDIEEMEDPTSSSGCCKVCGSDKWVINDNKPAAKQAEILTARS